MSRRDTPFSPVSALNKPRRDLLKIVLKIALEMRTLLY